MTQMISEAKFRALAKEYRQACKHEVSNFAIQYGYEQFIQGDGTPLIEKMEQHFGRSLNTFVPKEETNVLAKRVIKPKFDFNLIDPLILEPQFNMKLRTQTGLYALENGKNYFIESCSYHGQSLFMARRMSSHVCCICRYIEHEDVIKQTIQRFLSSRQAA